MIKKIFFQLVFFNFFFVKEVFAAESGGMPQLNPEFWISQIFWLTLTFGILYIILSKIILPKISTNLELTLYILAVFIINQILSLFLKDPVKKREIEVLDQQGNVSTSLQESFSNIKLIKSYAKENLSIKILSNLKISVYNI